MPAGHPAHLVRGIVREELDLGTVLSAYTEPRGFPLIRLLRLMQASSVSVTTPEGRSATNFTRHLSFVTGSPSSREPKSYPDRAAPKTQHGPLLQDVEMFLGDPLAPVLEHEDTDAGHGRVETRRARVCTDVAWLAARQWPGLAAIGRVDRTRTCKRTGATTTDC